MPPRRTNNKGTLVLLYLQSWSGKSGAVSSCCVSQCPSPGCATNPSVLCCASGQHQFTASCLNLQLCLQLHPPDTTQVVFLSSECLPQTHPAIPKPIRMPLHKRQAGAWKRSKQPKYLPGPVPNMQTGCIPRRIPRRPWQCLDGARLCHPLISPAHGCPTHKKPQNQSHTERDKFLFQYYAVSCQQMTAGPGGCLNSF